ncbi:LOW QUALITY PROTEIN: hypothetical protein Cgig2_024249 [Carnegiea gigantea]|uniref:Uncharacterized protein n=1 Tax=Carnegiea gigantea TaxID=171969 RepID=A0A9Q1QAC1_9CARY|nr:LOW QUALITY PROTEIN: hypothetical protein Cgig2_024249 [Carnegiea gigantea]
MASDLNDGEAVVIGATTALLGAITTLLKNHNSTPLYYNNLDSRDTDNEIRTLLIPHQPYVNRDVDRENYINSVLYCADTHCLNQIRGLEHTCCKHEAYEYEKASSNVSSLSHNVRFRAIGGRFSQSTWTINSYFHIVLGAILKLYPNFVHPLAIVVGKDVARRNGAKSFDDGKKKVTVIVRKKMINN